MMVAATSPTWLTGLAWDALRFPFSRGGLGFLILITMDYSIFLLPMDTCTRQLINRTGAPPGPKGRNFSAIWMARSFRRFRLQLGAALPMLSQREEPHSPTCSMTDTWTLLSIILTPH